MPQRAAQASAEPSAAGIELEHLELIGTIPETDRARYEAALLRADQRAGKSGDHFRVIVEPPFIVIGDEKAARVKRRAARTVRWSVDLLKKAYFASDPDDVLEIWLFRNKRSYDANTRVIFDDDPGTPYGYYSSTHGALIMNIATGGGTLVHELVHPYMDTNVPDPPPWLNEGLGSLYEASSQRDGHIVGLLNWRLPGLQVAIRAGNVPTFRKLMAMNDNQFYGGSSGVSYAQARYLLYYMQEHGVLHAFWDGYLANRDTDPTGYKTMLDVLGVKNASKFQKKWNRYTLRLRYRR